jgi:hypothetical protein
MMNRFEDERFGGDPEENLIRGAKDMLDENSEDTLELIKKEVDKEDIKDSWDWLLKNRVREFNHMESDEMITLDQIKKYVVSVVENFIPVFSMKSHHTPEKANLAIRDMHDAKNYAELVKAVEEISFGHDGRPENYEETQGVWDTPQGLAMSELRFMLSQAPLSREDIEIEKQGLN